MFTTILGNCGEIRINSTLVAAICLSVATNQLGATTELDSTRSPSSVAEATNSLGGPPEPSVVM